MSFLYPKIIFFGDSLTQQAFEREGGTGTLLGRDYARKADVLNRGKTFDKDSGGPLKELGGVDNSERQERVNDEEEVLSSGYAI